MKDSSQSVEALPRHNIAKKRRKRRVQFEYEPALDVSDSSSSQEDEEESLRRPVKRRVLELSDLPKSSLLTQEEKARLWMQPEDHLATLHDVLAIIKTSSPSATGTDTEGEPCNNHKKNNNSDPNKVSFGQYAEALTMTFQLCDTPHLLSKESSSTNTSNSSVWNIRTSHSVAQLALWASHHTCTRGVESKILPGLMAERQRRRTRAIQGVLALQKEQQEQQNVTVEDEEVRRHSLSCLSLSLTHSAKEFASALAVVDGRQALEEYMALGETQKQTSLLPNHDENAAPTASSSSIGDTAARAERASVKRQHVVVTPTEEDRKRNVRRISIS